MTIYDFRKSSGLPELLSLKLGYFGKVETAHFHGGRHHVEGFLAAGPHRTANGLNTTQHLNQALVEAEVPDAGFHLSAFDQKGPVTGHSRKDLFIRINFADVPHPGNEDSTLRAADHLLGCLLTAGGEKHDVGRGFAHLIGQGESMTGYLDLADFPAEL